MAAVVEAEVDPVTEPQRHAHLLVLRVRHSYLSVTPAQSLDTVRRALDLIPADVPSSDRAWALATAAQWRLALDEADVARVASAAAALDDAALEHAVLRRSRDWSQVRPEWGLAGNAAFIVAPRDRTRHLELQGRAFLHDYDWRRDENFPVLELIMTAPVVVASWISLQYFGSTVDNEAFGCGNKTLHNIVGSLGVLEGNGGDLRVGLPMQTLHDGKRHVHEPLRLNALLEAPTEAIEQRGVESGSLPGLQVLPILGLQALGLRLDRRGAPRSRRRGAHRASGPAS